MSTDDPNPYQASLTKPKPQAEKGSIEYMRAVQYVFESPKWVPNLLWGSLCILTTQVIPIVGQLVWMGYQFEIVEDLLCSPPKKGHLEFDTNRLKEYIMRGLWIFLVMLILGFILVPIMLGIMACGFGAVAALAAATDGDEETMTIGAIVLIAIGSLVMFIVWVLMVFFQAAFTIRAGLTQDFRASFDLAWIKDFIRTMWIEILLTTIFMIAVAMIAVFVGMLACFVGVFPAIAFIFLVQGHLYLQLYQLYLSRGGQKIPLKPASTV